MLRERTKTTIVAADTAAPVGLDFALPPELEADAPPEGRGLARDGVRLLVTRRADDAVVHAGFREFGHFLDPGDLLVINTSGTLNAALPATRADGTPLALHLSTRLPAGLWSVEVRQPRDGTTIPFRIARPGESLALPGGGVATLHAPRQEEGGEKREERLRDTSVLPDPEPFLSSLLSPPSSSSRLWVASLRLPLPLGDYLAAYGSPIRYGYVRQGWPSEAYQAVYATELGSAEMPSAGRAFTPEIITGLVARGIMVAPLTLHTGVASQEEHEPPYEEPFRVPPATARLVNATRAAGARVVAVGTTVVRALETATDESGTTHPAAGWTDLVITPGRGLRATDALLTGLHEPRASHLLMLEALAGRAHLRVAYEAALAGRYLWHEFGDLHLIL